MARYILNCTVEDAATRMHAATWPVDADEPHGAALAAGDLALVYAAAPAREFVGRVEIASAIDAGAVRLAHAEEWDPPVPMDVVLASLDASAKAKADFGAGVVRITEHEYDTVLALAEGRVRPGQ